MGNLILTGMPGSGHVSLAKDVAERAGMRFSDMEEVITRNVGMSLMEILSLIGQSRYRSMEEALSRQLAKESGFVIAASDGVVTSDECVSALRAGGVIAFIDTPVDQITADPEAMSHPAYRRGMESVGALHDEIIGRCRDTADHVIGLSISRDLAVSELVQLAEAVRDDDSISVRSELLSRISESGTGLAEALSKHAVLFRDSLSSGITADEFVHTSLSGVTEDMRELLCTAIEVIIKKEK